MNQYAIQGVIHYYGWLPETIICKGGCFSGSLNTRRNADVSLWTIPPHVRLANLPTYDAKGANMTPRNDLQIDAASVESFLKRYGVLYRMDISDRTFKIDNRIFTTAMPDQSKTRGPRMIEAAEVTPGFQFKESSDAFSGAQYLLRKAWTGDSKILADHFNDGTLHFTFKVASFEIRRLGEVVLETEDLWEYMRYLFLTDYSEGRTGVCQRKDCPTPYFIQQRRGQRYCSHDCAVLENVRRFRAKERKK